MDKTVEVKGTRQAHCHQEATKQVIETDTTVEVKGTRETQSQ